MNRLEVLSLEVQASSNYKSATGDNENLTTKVDRLQRENNDLKEIHEMEIIIQM